MNASTVADLAQTERELEDIADSLAIFVPLMRHAIGSIEGRVVVDISVHDLPPEFVAGFLAGKHQFVERSLSDAAFESVALVNRHSDGWRISLNLYSRDIPKPAEELVWERTPAGEPCLLRAER
jgi:hypothetical protein